MHLTFANHRTLSLDTPRLVGILNITPDSFSDGGTLATVDHAVQRGLHMIQLGADIIDIGGESTRPGAERIPPDIQLQRILPVIQHLSAHTNTPISVDTTRASVALAALKAGASIINDVSAGRDDPDMFALIADRGCPCILMHMLGQPATMQADPTYTDVVTEVRDFLLGRAQLLLDAHLPPEQIILDPGIGFGKTLDHNLQLLASLQTFTATPHPVLIGASRKSFLAKLTDLTDPAQRDVPSSIITAFAVEAGVQLHRVHNIPIHHRAARIAHALVQHKSQ